MEQIIITNTIVYMKKLFYLMPVTDVISLAPMQETLQTSSVNLIMIEGADVTFETEATFDSFFGS